MTRCAISARPYAKGSGCRGYPKAKEAQFIAAGKAGPGTVGTGVPVHYNVRLYCKSNYQI